MAPPLTASTLTEENTKNKTFKIKLFSGDIGPSGEAGIEGPSGPKGQKGEEGKGLSGVKYVRWGRTSCSGDAQVIYTGKCF